MFSVLKREDEKWATERAYDNPKFVEDLVRDVLLRLSEHPSVDRLAVTSESIESIHNHNAYASTKTPMALSGRSPLDDDVAARPLAAVD